MAEQFRQVSPNALLRSIVAGNPSLPQFRGRLPGFDGPVLCPLEEVYGIVTRWSHRLYLRCPAASEHVDIWLYAPHFHRR